MQFITNLTGFVLGQALSELGHQGLEQLRQHYADPKQELTKALNQANTRAWRVLELACAENSVASWLKQRLLTGAEQGVLAPLRTYLQTQAPEFKNTCLTQLRAAKTAGLLTPDPSGQKLLAVWSQDFSSQAAPELQLKKLTQTLHTDLQATYPELTQLLTAIDPQWLPQAFSYFLRHAVATYPTLREMLKFGYLQHIRQEQNLGFAALEELLSAQGTALESELEQIGSSMTEILEMQQQIYAKLTVSARKGGISPRLSSVLRSSSDARLLEEMEQRLVKLPETAHTPEILDAIGRLAVAVGKFDIGQQHFTQAATAAKELGADKTQEAEAHYNTYRTLLEQQQWEPALQALLTAATLDPLNFAPFPLAKYTPQKILGAGGFGVAFLCQDEHFAESVVIKSLYQEELDRNITDVFQEGRILRRLQHPGIIDVIYADYADTDNKQRPFLVMEYFPGQSLTQYIERHGSLSVEQTLALAKLMAEALQAAHAQGVWHRDLKPDNLLVRREQDAWQIKLIDFGLAVAGQQVVKTVVTGLASKSILGLSLGGTYQYSAPEQLGIQTAKIGPWSDVYAFGKTLSFAIFNTVQPTLRHYRKLGDNNLADLLSDCLEQDPKDRPQDFTAVLQALGIKESTPISPPPIIATTNPDLAQQQREGLLKLKLKSQYEAGLKRLQEREEQRKQEAELKRQQELEAQRKREAEAKRQQELAERRKREVEALPNIHGWTTHKECKVKRSGFMGMLGMTRTGTGVDDASRVQALQQQVAQALGQSVNFRDQLANGQPGPEMVLIPPGKFLMGSPETEKGRTNSEKQHEVTISKPFAIGKYQVTNAQYRLFRPQHNSGNYAFRPQHGSGKYEGLSLNDDEQPVVRVSWQDAAAYCAWLSEQTGKSYRLATEAEWEYACRAGTATSRYWGDDPDQACQYANVHDLTSKRRFSDLTWTNHNCDNGYAVTAPVGQFKPNAFGLYDMLGNVWEFTCSAWAKPYDGREKVCSNSDSGVCRGGSWKNDPSNVRAANRSSCTGGPYDSKGFRIVGEDL